MAELVNGMVGPIDQILTASPIDDGVEEDFKWKIDTSALDGIIATAKHGPHTYNVSIDKVRVDVITDTHAEIEAKAKATSEPTPTSTPAKAKISAEEKKAIEDTKTVAALAPNSKTKKEAQKVLNNYKK